MTPPPGVAGGDFEEYLRTAGGHAFGVYAAMFVYAGLLTGAAGFYMLACVFNPPRLPAWTIALVAAPLAFSMWHVLHELRNPRREQVARWGLFLTSVALLAIDPFLMPRIGNTAARVCCTMLVLGATLLGIARLWFIPGLAAFRDLPKFVQLAAAIGMWIVVPTVLIPGAVWVAVHL